MNNDSPSSHKALTTSLEQVPAGTVVRIVEIRGGGATERRLRELGLAEGAECRVVRRAPFGGPLELSFGSTRIGLRLADGLVVMVEVLSSASIAA